MAIRFHDFTLAGGVITIRPLREDIGEAMKFQKKRKDKVYQLEIKEYRKKRSLNANAMAWALIHQIAKVLGITPLEVYQDAVRNVGDNYIMQHVLKEEAERFEKIWTSQGDGWQCRNMGIKDGYVIFMSFYGSSVFDTAQMARLIDSLIQDCHALGIETMSQEELASLLKEE